MVRVCFVCHWRSDLRHYPALLEITMSNILSALGLNDTNHCPKCGAIIEFAQCDYRICDNCDWRGNWTALIQKSDDPPIPKDQYVLEEIKRERQRRYGGITALHEENLTPNDWVAVICAYAGRAAQKVDRNTEEQCSFRRSMISVAALAMAAIETQDKLNSPL